MADVAKPEKLTLSEASKDLGWFPMLLVGLGGFSILTILEQGVFRQPFELVQIFQWPLDGYHRVMQLLGAIVEPLIQPRIDWVNSRRNWSLTLDPVWRPLFALCMVFVMALIRTEMRTKVRTARGIQDDIDLSQFTIAALIGAASFVAAIFLAVFASVAGWIAQGAIAFVPVVTVALIFAIPVGLTGDWIQALGILSGFGAIALVFFAIGAGLYFAPGLSEGAGLFALGALIALLGAVSVRVGLITAHRYFTRLGLTILGGFVAAGLILGADFGLKALGAT